MPTEILKSSGTIGTPLKVDNNAPTRGAGFFCRVVDRLGGISRKIHNDAKVD